MNQCFECGATDEALHDHHVVPRSLGGTRTVPLCEVCHGLIHGKDLRISELTKAALAALKDQGVKLGRPAQVTPEVLSSARRLREDGMPWKMVAERLGVESAALQKAMQRAKG